VLGYPFVAEACSLALQTSDKRIKIRTFDRGFTAVLDAENVRGVL